MATVKMSTEVNVPADKLWEMIGGFNALPDWHPAVEKSELKGKGKGATRTLSLAGGGTIVERLEEVNDKEHVYTYTIMDSPLPVANYVATIRVREESDGKKSILEWSGEFKPAGASEQDAMKVVQGIYQAGFDNLRKMFGG